MSEQPKWMDRIVVGSVLSNGGQARIVRNVTRHPSGRLYAVTFLIRHCSWTGRCYTVLSANDLRQFGYRLLPVKPRQLRGEFHDLVRKAIHGNEDKRKGYTLTCCDVVGIP